MSLRIHELARLLNVEAKDLLNLLRERGYVSADTKSVSSTISAVYIEEVEKEFAAGRDISKEHYLYGNSEIAQQVAESRIRDSIASQIPRLNLGRIGFSIIPKFISEIRHVRELILFGNRIAELPSELFQLTNLEILDLGGNELTSVPEALANLSRLRMLKLAGNQLHTIPDSFEPLINLRELSLNSNDLTTIPNSIGLCKDLQFLYLHENQLVALPESFEHIKNLRELTLYDNPPLGLPADLVKSATVRSSLYAGTSVGALEIIAYYFQTLKGTRPLNEGKLILLGRGEVGKTCLVNRLVYDKFINTSMTKGISITHWALKAKSGNVRLHVWDFGGQEIQHATHQFFLTDRSLYLVVLNGRAGAEDEDAEYWLKFIKTFGDSSPTIVILNKFKIQPFQLNRRYLMEKYPFISGFVETDCGVNNDIGILTMKRMIQTAVEGMEHISAAFPSSWFQIKERLSRLQQPFISFADYREICRRHGEQDPSAQDRLAKFLNALGIALNFNEDRLLRDETVLNPHWITEGVYQIITSPLLAEHKGELRLSDLCNVLPQEKYPTRMHRFLIELMRKFELCFPFEDDQTEPRYLIPELLGKEQPDINATVPITHSTTMRYEYRLMPEGLLPRFITRTHTMSHPDERWRTGVVLRWENSIALIKADKQERQVTISAIGHPDHRRRLIAVIRENFDHIHAEMREFRPAEFTALLGHINQWVRNRDLEVFEKNHIPTLHMSVGDSVVPVQVTGTLDQVDIPGARSRETNSAVRRDGLKLVISYAHDDEKWRRRLAPNLDLLKREGIIDVWCDLEILPGMRWNDEIRVRFDAADIYLFLVSTNLLISDYVFNHEMPIAKEREKAGIARIVPVILLKCSWKPYFGEHQALPHEGREVSSWAHKDEAFHDVEIGLRKIIEHMHSSRAPDAIVRPL